jgi:hypothetical protein
LLKDFLIEVRQSDWKKTASNWKAVAPAEAVASWEVAPVATETAARILKQQLQQLKNKTIFKFKF